MNAKITFVELVDLMAGMTSTSKRVCELFLRDLFATISQAIIDGENVKVKGVGTFKVTRVKPRKSVNVNTGEAIQIAGYSKVTFTPDKALAEAVNQPFAQFETVFLDDAMTDERLADIDKQYPSTINKEPQTEEKPSPSATAQLESDMEPDTIEPQWDDLAAPAAPLPFELPEMQEAAPAPAPDTLFDSLIDGNDIAPASPTKETEPVKEKPVKEEKPVEKKPAKEKKPIKEEKPVKLEKPVEEKKPIEAKPVEEKKPAVAKPIKEKKPVKQEKPVEEKKPIEAKPVVEKKPAVAKPIKEKKPVEQEKPIEEKKPIEAKPVEEKKPAVAKPVEEKKPQEEPKHVSEPVRKPMLVGRPIDGPSQPVPEPEPEEEVVNDRHFYRPEPRNVYTPTPEQIEEASHKRDYRWLWMLLTALVAALAFWLIARGCSDGQSEQQEHVVVAADTIADDEDEAIAEAKPEVKSEPKAEPKPEVKPEPKPEPKPEVKPEPKPEPKPEVKPEPKAEPKAEAKPAGKEKVVTDVVTSRIVLTTLSEKHYGSPWFWVYIYEENVARGIINNPNNIKPGTRVVIPPREKYGINPKDKASLKKAQIKSMEYLK